jgi:hypothetical protein
MLASMTSSQFAEWMTYSSIDQFGERRSELRHGQLMQLLHAAHFKTEGSPRPVTSFMNFIDEPEEPELTPEQINECFKGMFGVG